MAPIEAPAALVTWIERLGYAPIRLYAERFMEYRLGGSGRPQHPGKNWVGRVEKKVDHLLGVTDGYAKFAAPRDPKKRAPRRKSSRGGRHSSERQERNPGGQPTIGLDGSIDIPPAVRTERLENALAPGRARFSLISSGFSTLGDLHGGTWSQLAALDGVGVVGLRNLAMHVDMLNRRYGGSEDADAEEALASAATEPGAEEEATPDSWAYVGDILRALVTTAGEFSSAESVWDALEDLQALAAQCGFEHALADTPIENIARGGGIARRASDEADDLVREFAERERRILEERILSANPIVLEELGAEFGVTRERVRQLQARMEDNLARRLSPHVDAIANIVRARLGAVVCERSVTEVVAALFDDLERPGTQLARKMVTESLGYAVVEGVGLDPEAVGVVEALKSAARSLADSVGLVAPDALQAVLPDEKWLDHWEELLLCAGLCRLFGHVALRQTAQARVMAAVLDAGHPVNAEEVAELTAIDERTVRANFSRLEAISRVDKTRWWYRDWIEDEYEGIATEIIQRIQEDGGGTALGRLLQELPERFGVTESSVRAYVATPHFSVKDGFVSLADLGSYRYRDLEDVIDGRTKEGAPYWTFSVKPQYLTGYSLMGLPPVLVKVLGGGPNESVEAPLREPAGCANLTVSWRASTPTGPSLGRLAAPLKKLQVAVGDDMCLICFDDGSVGLRPYSQVATGRTPVPEKGKRSKAGLEAADDLLEQLKRRRRVL